MIQRAPEEAARGTYDLIVAGGGIYGARLALEASLRDLRVLLIERSDFGGATSWNSLRIVHGGLRYLRDADLVRFRESVRERSWFLRVFPDQVARLPCLMPLYGDGLRRPSVLRAALWLNDLLSASRIAGVRQDRRLPAGRVLGPDETADLLPGEVFVKTRVGDTRPPATRSGWVYPDCHRGRSAVILPRITGPSSSTRRSPCLAYILVAPAGR